MRTDAKMAGETGISMKENAVRLTAAIPAKKLAATLQTTVCEIASLDSNATFLCEAGLCAEILDLVRTHVRHICQSA